MHDDPEFRDFVAAVQPRLRRALVATRGLDGAADGAAEAVAYAWEHWDRVRAMENPTGYLYRVGQSRTRRRRRGFLPAPASVGIPEIEPRLIPALDALPDKQRTVVWLVHACEWTHGEVAEALGITASTVSTHAQRGLARLRHALEVESRV